MEFWLEVERRRVVGEDWEVALAEEGMCLVLG